VEGRAPGFFGVPVPVLGGTGEETIFPGVHETASEDGWRLFEREGLLIGAIDVALEDDLGAQTYRLYRRLLTLAGSRRLARVWNYVPRINEPDASGLENYRAFCRGRSLAFEERLGDGYERHLPAASAVGGADDRLTIIFTATPVEPAHFENPDQVPAYAYPEEHGPRAPSFSRATRVEAGGSHYVFISGTAAIKGHATVASGDLDGQIACTLDNLRIISGACGLGGKLGAGAGWERHFKIYLRHAEDYEKAMRALTGALYTASDRVTWLRADICRAALLIEIEATLTRLR
jgi:hypothetical protein